MQAKFFTLFALLFSVSAYAGQYSKADLYRLNNEIVKALDENQVDVARVQQAAAALEEAKRLITRRTTIPAALTFSDGPTYDFGTITAGSVLTKVFTLTNFGGSAAEALAAKELKAPFSFKGGVFPGTGGTCGQTLGVSASCTVVVQFAPANQGVFSEALAVSYDDGYEQQVSTRALQGQGI